ncbi:MAG: type I DNA topoisomerase [Spirochaetia bacterium]|nr:type I DNA topoisomerase [Spirochaetia bacterium]
MALKTKAFGRKAPEEAPEIGADGKPKKKPSPRISKAELKDKTLVIVESPAKARTINKYLGKNYVIEASMGHIIDLPKSRMAVNVDDNFQPEYITVRGRTPILNRLKKLASATSKVFLATDPDCEGEAISWHLSNALGPLNKDIKRIEFHEITKAAVQEAVGHPRDIDMSLVNAQQARRIMDRLVGYNISPLLWKKIKRGLSAGRVQSVALRLICEREREIEAFTPEEYWTVEAEFQHGKSSFDATLHSVNGEKVELKNEEQVKGILTGAEELEYKITSVSTKERRRQPTAPYTTSRMQQDAANKLGYTSQKTMMVAQQLYEGLEVGHGVVTGLITYMRTDSVRVSPAAIDQVREYVKTTLGDTYLSPEVRDYKSGKSAQDAHEAIRPTDPARTPESIEKHLTKDQYRLYQLVWQKFVSSQMADEIADHTSADITGGNLLFRANGKVVKFAGFSEVFNLEDRKKKESVLPVLTEGDQLKVKHITPEQHFTQPPARFTDASMVKILEESGVGRPSTYAPTIGTLLKRYYCVRIQKALKPTELGRLVNDVMEKNFSSLVDIDFTAKMEDDLDRVARSDMDWVQMLRNFYPAFADTIKHAFEHISEMRNALDVETDLVCEKCGRKMVKKIGRNGYFLACSGFPECRNAKAIPLGKCPKCETGDVVQRATKRGRPFFGCNRYPECDYSTWDKPSGEVCPKCGKILLEKSSREKGKYTACSACDYEAGAQSA